MGSIKGESLRILKGFECIFCQHEHPIHPLAGEDLRVGPFEITECGFVSGAKGSLFAVQVLHRHNSRPF
jgi:hypothetical protein